MPNEGDPLEAARVLHDAVSARGFDWPDVSGVLAKLKEEIREIEEALDRNDLEHAKRELGDVLFTAVNLARFLRADASAELRATAERFRARFDRLDARLGEQGRCMEECTLDELDVEWEHVKRIMRRDAKTS